MYKRTPATFSEAFEFHSLGEYDSDFEFDCALWALTCTAIQLGPEFKSIPEPLLVFYSIRSLQLEVGNGGLTQAVMNKSELFEIAARGYLVLGKPQLASLVREIEVAVVEMSKRIAKARGTLEDAHEFFRERPFETFENQLDEMGFWGNEEMLSYLKANQAEIIRWRPPGDA